MIISETAATARCGREVAQFFRRMEPHKVAFAEWEDPLVNGTAQRFPKWNALALKNDEIAGAIIGGETLGLGSISHMAICREHRRFGVGSKLVSETVSRALSCTKASRIHLMVTEGNEEAIPFWTKHGFEISEPAVELTVNRAAEKCPGDDSFRALGAEAVGLLVGAEGTLHERLKMRERIAIAEDLLHGNARAWCTVEHGAVVFAATLGVRGIIRLFALQEGCDPAACAAMLTAGISHIANLGVFRIHSFPTTEQESELLHEAGFRVQEGETTMCRHLH